MKCLMVDGFVVGFTVELCFEREKVKRDMLVLVAFDVLEAWFEVGSLQCGDNGVGQVPVGL